jgi:16S rRNA (uracil1498-N3)-methyltransferase
LPIFNLNNHPDAEGLFPLPSQDEKHILKSLRLKAGDSLLVRLPDGQQANAKLIAHEGTLVGKIIEILKAPSKKKLPLWLGVGLTKLSRFEWLIEKITELGVERLSPLILLGGRYAGRKELSGNKIERWKKIAAEALKQSEGLETPIIDTPQSLKSWLTETQKMSGPKLLFQARNIAGTHPEKFFTSNTVHFFLLGPEGGFQTQELNMALQFGFSPVTLGDKILKTETAAIYAACLLDSFLGKSK